MAIVPVITLPNPMLKQVSSPVEVIDGEIKKIISDMVDTLNCSGHGVGIAAVQIGELFRIIVVNVSLNPKPHHNNGQLIMINPEIVYSSGKLKSREGCMSVPGFTGNVTRKNKIEVEYTDINGIRQKLKTHGFESIVIQHEIDHLNGLVFLDRVTSLKTDIFKRI